MVSAKAIKILRLWIKIFIDMNQICRDLLSKNIAFVLSKFFSNNSIAGLFIFIQVY
ncbi:hypothetical protein IMSAGC005_03751 [Lachnospiraceae bacterium]|nr:hypothetical protein IMSAGC005_03751 [Lachnospiraceae bacterium]